jgi:hypothetical protein
MGATLPPPYGGLAGDDGAVQAAVEPLALRRL